MNKSDKNRLDILWKKYEQQNCEHYAKMGLNPGDVFCKKCELLLAHLNTYNIQRNESMFYAKADVWAAEYNLNKLKTKSSELEKYIQNHPASEA